MHQAFNSAQIDKGTELGDVCDRADNDGAGLQRFKEHFAAAFAGLSGALREDNAFLFGFTFNDFEL